MTLRQAQGSAPTPVSESVSVSEPAELTTAQRQLDALAAELAARNPDAAEELARRMAHHAAQHKRVRGFGISIHVNLVTGRLELNVGA